MVPRLVRICALMTLATACQTSAPVSTDEPAVVAAPVTKPAARPSCGGTLEAHLEWLDGFVVSWRAVLNPASGDVTVFEGSNYGAALDPARSRTAAVRYEAGGESIELRTFAGELLKEFEVDVFVEAPDLDAERLGELRSTTVFWWSPRELLVLQDTLPSEFYVSCKMLDVETGKWSATVDCPYGGMVDLADLRRGPADLAALVSSGEGHPAVDVVRWTPGKPQQTTKFPSFDLYPFGPMAVRFTGDPAVLFIETPCDLRVERGCATKVGDEEDYSGFLFRWREDGGLTLERSELPPGATYDTKSGTWAWPTTRGIAVGDPDGDFDCHEFEWPD